MSSTRRLSRHPNRVAGGPDCREALREAPTVFSISVLKGWRVRGSCAIVAKTNCAPILACFGVGVGLGTGLGVALNLGQYRVF